MSNQHVLAGAPLPPAPWSSVLEATDRHASATPGRRALVVAQPGSTMSWLELKDRSLGMAARLAESGVGRGDLVGILLRNDGWFVPALLGLWRLGGVGVPVPVPGAFADVEPYAGHVRAMIAAAGIEHVVYDPSLSGPHLEAAMRLTRGVSWLDGTTAPAGSSASAWTLPDATDLALVQYTSGSTSSPKGVELTHANMTAAVTAFGLATELGPDDSWAVWMPLFHDFALISTLTALAFGATVWAWQPTQFIRQPARWLANFGRNGLTHYSGPNFSFNLMHDAMSDDLFDGVSLAGWKVAVSGGEQVSAETIRRFTERFAPFGFRAEAMIPGYGMAEATLAITVTPLRTRPRALTLNRQGITDRRAAEPVADADPTAREVVCVGRPAPGIALRIVDEEGAPRSNGRVGEIEVSGPSISRGYRGFPDVLRDGWLATGDLGFVDQGGLFIVGRSKDVVNLRGVKYHPEDLEPVVTTVGGVRRCCIVGEGETDERMAVIAETRARGDDLSRVRGAIRDSLVRLLGIDEVNVYLVEPHTILMTSSGKTRRQLMRRLLESGEVHDLEPVADAREVPVP